MELMLAKYRGSLDEESSVLFGHLQDSVSQLQKLVAGLKTYLRIMGSPCACRSCSAGDLLMAALTCEADAIHQSDAVVTFDQLPQVSCDPNQIVFLLSSLIDNAIKFRRNHAPRIHVYSVLQDRECVISVQDDGIGIDPRHADLLFRLFRRINAEAYSGAGVGLAIARQIADRHGGRIWFESEPGSGCRFSFTLPMAA
jgi:signal transduction histidine kinase